VELPEEEKQMRNSSKKNVHASSHCKLNWKAIDWKTVEQKVRELQMRIAKAVRERRYRKVQSLQWLLTHSFYAKLLAVKRVVTNKGGKTPGVDGVVWKTPKQRMQAVKQLYRRGYCALPLRRMYIKKKSGKRRPLGIPTMRDRGMQALYSLALAPVAETTADLHSYGFREYRSCADAIEQCFVCLSRRRSAKWVLEADVEACFDQIDHEWTLNNIPIDKKILKAWLKAGYMEKGKIYPTKAGAPQGGVISPMLANMTLDGLESAVKNAVARTNKVNVIRFADDFVVTGDTEAVLEQQVIPAINGFLNERGLNLSREKTKITRIEDGFDFLGQHLRKFGGKLIIAPSKSSVKSLINKVRRIMKASLGLKTSAMIRQLNTVIRGWTNYHRHVCSKATFSHIDNCIHKNLWNWAKRRHPGKGKRWIYENYFRTIEFRNWIFSASDKTERGETRITDLLFASATKIVRHVQIRAKANPYDRDWQGYFAARTAKRPGRAVPVGANW
jgi:RNA-directed DNA polymerase